MKYRRGAAVTDLIFFIFFLVVLGIIWSLTGGPERSISRDGPFLNPPFPLGDGSAYSVPGVNVPDIDRTRSSRSGGGSGSIDEEENTFEGLISRIRSSFGNPQEGESPYSGLVSLRARNARDQDVDDQYLTITISSGVERPIRVSNWRVESSVTLLGVDVPDVSYLPYSGQVNPGLPLDAQPGALINVITGRSPIGTSFRTNLCTGYFTQFQDFTPRISDRDCPTPEDELRNAIDGGFIPNDACLDYVERIERCTLVVDSLPGNIGSQCSNFILEEITYNGCVDAHKNEDAFYNNEWYVYLGRDQALWKQSRERIVLKDENGLVIDSVSY